MDFLTFNLEIGGNHGSKNSKIKVQIGRLNGEEDKERLFFFPIF